MAWAARIWSDFVVCDLAVLTVLTELCSNGVFLPGGLVRGRDELIGALGLAVEKTVCDPSRRPSQCQLEASPVPKAT